MNNDKVEKLLDVTGAYTIKMAGDIEDIKEILKPSESLEIDEAEKDGKLSISKYFDRINDKLNSYNNMLVAVYFALTQFDKSTPKLILLVPMVNMFILIAVDYYMMEYNRKLSDIKNIPMNETKKIVFGKSDKATQLSLITILSTFVVTVVLLFVI